MTNAELVDRIVDLQADAYERFGVYAAPRDKNRYEEMVDWIDDQIRKTAYADLITEAVVEMVDDTNAHMAAEAAGRVVSGQ